MNFPAGNDEGAFMMIHRIVILIIVQWTCWITFWRNKSNTDIRLVLIMPFDKKHGHLASEEAGPFLPLSCFHVTKNFFQVKNSIHLLQNKSVFTCRQFWRESIFLRRFYNEKLQMRYSLNRLKCMKCFHVHKIACIQFLSFSLQPQVPLSPKPAFQNSKTNLFLLPVIVQCLT